MLSCELCDEGKAYCVIGIWENTEQDPEEIVTLEKNQVKYACPMCAERLVKKEIAREYPMTPEEADAYEVWGKKDFALVSEKGGTIRTPDNFEEARNSS